MSAFVKNLCFAPCCKCLSFKHYPVSPRPIRLENLHQVLSLCWQLVQLTYEWSNCSIEFPCDLWGMLSTFLQFYFELEFPETLKSKHQLLSLTESVWKLQNIALQDIFNLSSLNGSNTDCKERHKTSSKNTYICVVIILNIVFRAFSHVLIMLVVGCHLVICWQTQLYVWFPIPCMRMFGGQSRPSRGCVGTGFSCCDVFDHSQKWEF